MSLYDKQARLTRCRNVEFGKQPRIPSRSARSEHLHEFGVFRGGPAPRDPGALQANGNHGRTPCLRNISFYGAAFGGRKGTRGMKTLVMSVVAGAAVFAGPMTAHAQSVDMEASSITETEGLPRLPNVFRDCWEPLPSHCVRPPGLLWFGSVTTLQHERRAASHRSRIRAAISR
jgi:hypothetical protein